MLLSSGSTKLKVKDVDFDPRPRPCHRPCCHGSPFLLEVTHSVKKEGLGLSAAADRGWRMIVLKYWVALLLCASRTVIYPYVSTWLAVSHWHFRLFKQKPCASCLLELS